MNLFNEEKEKDSIFSAAFSDDLCKICREIKSKRHLLEQEQMLKNLIPRSMTRAKASFKSQSYKSNLMHSKSPGNLVESLQNMPPNIS